MTLKIDVKKRDGSFEEFNPDKIMRVLQAAGLETSQAKLVADAITAFVNHNGENTISSRQIREKVIEELSRINRYVADLFAWYESTKER